jgi:RNA polymerase sigma-70 factor (ECF subfamily)
VSPEPRDRAQEPDDGASLVYEETLVLVGAAQKGDRNALESLFERYLPRVRRTAALRTGWRLNQFVEFDDIAQDTLIKVFQGLDRFEQKFEGSFRNWLANCVQCEIADQARRAVAKKRGGGKVRRFGDCASETLVSSIFAGDEKSPSEVVQVRELGEQLESVLLDMPKHSREVIILRYLCELTYEEIAAEMGLGQEATARKACSRALQKLKEKMAAAE